MGGISIIVVNWNGRDFLRGCLASIRQTGGGLVSEVIVVDNGSTDGSVAMVSEEFPEVRLIRSKENLGFARANNIGINAASGDWIALINSDIVVHAGCFQQLVAALESHREVGLVGPRIFGADGRLQRTCRRLPTLWNTICRVLAIDSLLRGWPLFSGREMRHWKHDEEARVEVLSGCFLLARGEAVREVGGLDERFFFYAEDVDWCKRFDDANWGVMFAPTATATHFGGGSSLEAPARYTIQQIRANLDYWRKHSGPVGRLAFYALWILHHVLRM